MGVFPSCYVCGSLLYTLKNKYTLKCALKPYPLLGSFVLTVAKSRKLASYGHLEKKDTPHGLQGPAQWIPAPASAPSLPHAPWLHLQWPFWVPQAHSCVLLPQCLYKDCSIFL